MTEAIKTRPVTAEYEAGFVRAFGEPTRKPGRTRYVMRGGELVEVGAEWEDRSQRVPVVGDAHYDGLRMPDGTDVSSRTKHREYLKATGTALASDYTETWAKAAKERASNKDPERRHQIGKALYEYEKHHRLD